MVGELGAVVGHQCTRNPKSGEDVSFVEAEDIMQGDLRESLGLDASRHSPSDGNLPERYKSMLHSRLRLRSCLNYKRCSNEMRYSRSRYI